MTPNVFFLIKVWVLLLLNSSLIQDATKLFNKVTDSVLHLVLGHALIGDFIMFRNKGLHLGLGMVAASKSRFEFEIW